MASYPTADSAPSGSRTHPARLARDPPVLRGPAAGHRPGGGRPDDTAVALAACAAARQAGVPVVARAEPGARGTWMIDLGADAATARAIQKSAAAAHQSQSDALPGLIRAGPARWPGSAALAGASVLRVRARQDDPGCGGLLPDRQRDGQHPPSTEQYHGLRGRSRPGQTSGLYLIGPCAVTCGIPTTCVKLRLSQFCPAPRARLVELGLQAAVGSLAPARRWSM